MLIRILLLVESPQQRRRVHRLLEHPDTLVSAPARRLSGPGAQQQESWDLVVVDKGRLGGPPASGVAKLRGWTDRPEVVVLDQEDDPGARSVLQAAGTLPWCR